MNDDLLGTCNADSQIKVKTSMLRTDLCDYSDTCIFLNWTIAITGVGNDNAATRLDERN